MVEENIPFSYHTIRFETSAKKQNETHWGHIESTPQQSVYKPTRAEAHQAPDQCNIQSQPHQLQKKSKKHW